MALSRIAYHTMQKCRMKNGIESNRIPYDAEMPDEDDRVFYEVALSKDDAYLVTGNLKHFPATPIVVTPAEMIEIILNQL